MGPEGAGSEVYQTAKGGGDQVHRDQGSWMWVLSWSKMGRGSWHWVLGGSQKNLGLEKCFVDTHKKTC